MLRNILKEISAKILICVSARETRRGEGYSIDAIGIIEEGKGWL